MGALASPLAMPLGGVPSVLAPTNPRPPEDTRTGLSLVIDPITRDLIDADDGWFVESTDSRTAVLFQLESWFAAWWGDPPSGSRNHELLQRDERPTGDELRDEALRALQPMVAEGIISDLAVALDRDDNGGTVVALNYRDLASGRLVDLTYVPFGG